MSQHTDLSKGSILEDGKHGWKVGKKMKTLKEKKRKKSMKWRGKGGTSKVTKETKRDKGNDEGKFQLEAFIFYNSA